MKKLLLSICLLFSSCFALPEDILGRPISPVEFIRCLNANDELRIEFLQDVEKGILGLREPGIKQLVEKLARDYADRANRGEFELVIPMGIVQGVQ